MKKHILFAALLSLVFSGQGNAESAVKFTVSPSVGHAFGETEYVLEISSYLSDENGDVITDQLGNPIVYRLKSQLEYPLDVFMAGATVGLGPTADPSLWSVKAGVFTSVNDPGGIMKDHDWIGILPDLTKWSYTESSAEMKSIILDLEVTRRILSPGKARVAAMAGFRYHRLEQDLFGADGWQRLYDAEIDTFDDPVYFDTLQTTQVLYYEVKYFLPQAGLKTDLELSPNLSLSARTALALVWFKDVDDHPFRAKLSEADGTGTGFIGSLSARYQLSSAGTGTAPYIGFSAEYTTLTSSGDQTQTWYGDDPASPDDDTGLRISGIPHEVNANWYHIGINLGMSF